MQKMIVINEKQFHRWVEDHIRDFGFDEVVTSQLTRFPDIVAKKDGERTRIEVETMSSNFLLHQHDPSMCDLVICLVKDVELPIKIVVVKEVGYEPIKTTVVTIHPDSWLKLNALRRVGESMASVVERLLKEREVR